MSEPYSRFTGQSLERLTALADGLLAVAMTLLVLDLRVPVSAAGPAYPEHGLWEAIRRMGPSFAAYLLSFTMLGTFWLAQHTCWAFSAAATGPSPGSASGSSSWCPCCRSPRRCSRITSTSASRWACTG